MPTRRQFLRMGTLAGAGLFLPIKWRTPRAFAQISGCTLDPGSIQKYEMPLFIPPAMPRTAKIPGNGTSIDLYEIAATQFQQQILPTGMPKTTVWSYGSIFHRRSFNYPAFTIEAKYNKPVRIRWINGLVDLRTGRYLPHLFSVDPTVHWANPAGGLEGRDQRPTFETTPGPYAGPVPVVTHLHGAHSMQESDGYPEAWYLPPAINLPSSYAKTGTYYDIFKESSPHGSKWTPGSAVFEYSNDQRATTLWYHDHTLGMTRLNKYAGLGGAFYIIRGGPDDQVIGTLPGPAPARGDSSRMKYYEIPIVIQDRSFNADGSLFYPDTRAFFDGFTGPYIPDSDVPPIWNPEFFGNTMVVNGRTWPYLEVEPRRYRFRFLNACNSRFLILKFENDLPFWQIGADGGFLPEPMQIDQLLIAPAERLDVIVDFTDVPVGARITLQNLGPDEPFGGGIPGTDFPAADPATTGQVMQFRVVPLTRPDSSTLPDQLILPAFTGLGSETNTRQVSLNEMMSTIHDGPVAAMLGTIENEEGVHKHWSDPVTENPMLNATEVWEIHNFTEDAHPIHIHLVQFQVVERQPFDGAPRAPESWETGYKDTVIAYPDEITRVKAKFDKAGLFTWHCHIVEHEDNEMMRPYQVGTSLAERQASEETTEGKPNTYALHQNYPNPFNPQTEIGFDLPEAGHVELKIFNNLGQEVRTLADGDFAAGSHVVRWDATDHFGQNLASGIYHYRIKAGSFTARKKMMLLR